MTMNAAVTTLLVLASTATAAGQSTGTTEPTRRMVLREIAAVREVLYQRGAHQETDRTSRTVTVGAGGHLDLSNLSGHIVVSRGGGNDATIEIVKTARAADAASAREMLKLVAVDVTERGGGAEVRARYPETRRGERRGPFNVSVAYTVTAPAGTRLSIRSLSGDIRVTDIEGELFLETMSGDVEIGGASRVGQAKTVSGDVTISRTRSDGALEAASLSGDVTLRDVHARRVRATSVSGAVVLEALECERVEAETMSGDVIFSSALTRGGRYELKSHSGDVRLEVVGDAGFDLDATSFSGTVRTDVPLKTRAGDRPVSRGPRTFRGVYGDGGAVVAVTTFSGNVVIRKR